MNAKHRITSTLFGLVVGLVVAWFSYSWITDEGKGVQRAEEEQVVHRARDILRRRLTLDDPEFVDPLSPKRSVGKVYIYPTPMGWEVSGYYRRNNRRNQDDTWHPFLMSLDPSLELRLLKVQDAALVEDAVADPQLQVVN